MPKPFTPKVVTANALLEGDVVYLTLSNTWSRHLDEAAVIYDEGDADLRLLQASAQTGLVVGAYLADVQVTSTGPAPVHFRENFRRRGPSNYAHGKQEKVPHV